MAHLLDQINAVEAAGLLESLPVDRAGEILAALGAGHVLDVTGLRLLDPDPKVSSLLLCMKPDFAWEVSPKTHP